MGWSLARPEVCCCTDQKELGRGPDPFHVFIEILELCVWFFFLLSCYIVENKV